MTRAPSEAMKRALARAGEHLAPSEDRLEAVRNRMREARDLEVDIAQLTETLKAKTAALQALLSAQLPEEFMELGIDKLGLLAEGNLPAYDATLKPFYKASISANWPQEQQDRAFAYLTKMEAGDLVKSTFVVELGRDTEETAARLRAGLQRLGVDFTERRAVNHNTLTAWLKEQVEKEQTTPDLEVLGAKVGKIVNLKPRKES